MPLEVPEAGGELRLLDGASACREFDFVEV